MTSEVTPLNGADAGRRYLRRPPADARYFGGRYAQYAAAMAPSEDTGDNSNQPVWPTRALRALAVVAAYAVVVVVSSAWQPLHQSRVTYRGVLEVREP